MAVWVDTAELLLRCLPGIALPGPLQVHCRRRQSLCCSAATLQSSQSHNASHAERGRATAEKLYNADHFGWDV